MNDKLSWSDDNDSAAQDDAPNYIAFGNVKPASTPPQHNDVSNSATTAAQDGAVMKQSAPHRGASSSSGKTSDNNADADWPPSGEIVLTTDEARIYMFRDHDMFLKERYVQRLVSEQKKVLGKKLGKPGGGSELQITQSSLDQYVSDNQNMKNAAEVVIDPDDKLYNQFLEIKRDKGYAIIHDRAVKTETAPRTETHRDATGGNDPADLDETPQHSHAAEVETAPRTETHQGAASHALYEFAKEQLVTFQRFFEEEKSDRKKLEDKIEADRASHKREKDDLIDELSTMTNEAIKARAERNRLLEAFNEATRLLPPDTTLQTDISDIVFPHQEKLNLPRHAVKIEVGDELQ